MKTSQKYLAAGLGLLAVSHAHAIDAAAEATNLVGTAETIFGLVAALSVTMIGFYMVVRVVKGIRK
jgi:hypothetical protein